ncbi:hypothetical protein B0T14DRAFT_513905 [Immersiella caudata]|uniref:Uncharacterized protein n=1 Tax=Immersiella caudata TaxID=314043 RepID=A0AA40C2D1_9PEZI|nr:hypothetical protein B0T14DRAFT_513905 [Immersiella caudata]
MCRRVRQVWLPSRQERPSTQHASGSPQHRFHWNHRQSRRHRAEEWRWKHRRSDRWPQR